MEGISSLFIALTFYCFYFDFTVYLLDPILLTCFNIVLTYCRALLANLVSYLTLII